MPQKVRDLQATPVDGYPTATSNLQISVENALQAHWQNLVASNPHHIPILQKNSHIQFLARNLVQGFPARYTSQDASQAWLIFWSLQSFCLLGVALDEPMKQRSVSRTSLFGDVLYLCRIINTLLAMQFPSGGFGGGPGQFPHLLSTYAAVCALAIVGKPGKNGGWDQIDR